MPQKHEKEEKRFTVIVSMVLTHRHLYLQEMISSSVAATLGRQGLSIQSSSTTILRCMSTASVPQASASTATPSSSDGLTSTDHYRITLRRSAIGLPDKIKGTLASLGLRKRLQSVYLPQRSDIAGMILGVKELVHVENVRRLREEEVSVPWGSMMNGVSDTETTKAILTSPVWVNEQNEVVDWGGREARKAPRGYTVVGNISNAVRNEEILQGKASID